MTMASAYITVDFDSQLQRISYCFRSSPYWACVTHIQVQQQAPKFRHYQCHGLKFEAQLLQQLWAMFVSLCRAGLRKARELKQTLGTLTIPWITRGVGHEHYQ